MTTPFQTRQPIVDDNDGLRIPQREVYRRLRGHAIDAGAEREVGIILPVGCGKSGCIALAPFAFQANRALVVAPGLTIASQLHADFDPANTDMFYTKSGTLMGGPYPEPVEIRGNTTNRGDLDEGHVVITNIQQLQGEGNRWLQGLPDDYFDLILFDEGHHNVASSWETLKAKFPRAKIVNFSATPLRADGKLMAGQVIYSYPVARAIQEGYVKRLKAVVLNPRTLRYVRDEDGVEIDVTLDEVKRLGEDDSDFRRSILTSKETLGTIVDASIRELQKLRAAAGDNRLKIIAAALNFAHCAQVVAAYRERGLRADFVHSREDGAANLAVMSKLENHQLDVIVQVRKLGEGFDHKYLAVAAVFNVFSNLSPFVQFVGRVMRVVKQNAPGDPANNGVVVFHAGANVARRWEDFQQYSEADQGYFDQLLPLEGLDFDSADELVIEPEIRGQRPSNQVEVKSQTGVLLEEIPLIGDDPDDLAQLDRLVAKYGAPALQERMNELAPIPVTKVRARQAKRLEISERVKTKAAEILADRGINPGGKDLDRLRLGKTNLVVMMSSLHRNVNETVGRKSGERDEFTRQQLDQIDAEWDIIVEKAVKETF